MNRSIQDQRIKLYISREQKLDNNIDKILCIYGDIALAVYSPWLKATKTKGTRKTITSVFGCYIRSS